MVYISYILSYIYIGRLIMVGAMSGIVITGFCIASGFAAFQLAKATIAKVAKKIWRKIERKVVDSWRVYREHNSKNMWFYMGKFVAYLHGVSGKLYISRVVEDDKNPRVSVTPDSVVTTTPLIQCA